MLNKSDQKKKLIKEYGKFFTPMRVRTMEHIGLDIFETKREGCNTTDIDGREYLDCLAVGGIFNLGRRHPYIVNALKNALEYLDIGNNFLMSVERLDLAKKLSNTTPGDVNCFAFGVSGGEAIDLAIKIARGYTNRPGIISAEKCYHGCTGFALSANGNKEYTEPFGPLMPGFSRVPFGDIDALRKQITKETAAVIFEPMIVEAGLLIPPDDYFAKVRELCDANETLIIIDEVVTGLGRTGVFWGIERSGIVPDIMVSAKGLSGGMYPISATMFTESVGDFFLSHPFSHYSSFGGPDLGCVAASAMLDISTKPEFLQNVNERGMQLRKGYEYFLGKYEAILDSFGQVGLMTVLRFKDPETALRLNHYLAEEGIFAILTTNNTSVMRIFPPLIISEKEVEFILDKLNICLDKFKH
jgi:putrescine aminotransferase